MTIKEEYNKLLVDIATEFPDFEIISKNDSKLMKIIDIALKIITFGQMKMFMTRFITTMGNKVYVPSDWDQYPIMSKASILRHERIHMRQAKKYGRFIFSVLYLLAPFPVGIAYFRKKFEQEAYEESLKTIYEWRGLKVLESPELKERTLSHFTSAEYFWMWPFRKNLESWYDGAVAKIKSGN